MTVQHPDDDRRIAYVLDELEPHERETIRTHLDGCDACTVEVERLARALAAARTARSGSAPLHLLVDLLDQQATARRRHASRQMLARLAVAAALGGVLFTSGYISGHRAIGRSTERLAVENRAPLRPLPPLPPGVAVTAATSADYLAVAPERHARGDNRTPGDSL